MDGDAFGIQFGGSGLGGGPLPVARGLARAARSSGALRRARGVDGPETLLRILLLHLAAGCSLSETAVRVRRSGPGRLSAVALFKRVQASEEWLRWLAIVLGILLFAAALGHTIGARAMAATGLPEGKVLFLDTRGGSAPTETVVSEKHGLVGWPDYLIEVASGLVPVEIKSTSVPPRGPYDNHVAQLMGYCLLAEDVLQRPVAEGILRYRDGEVRIPFTAEKREWILRIVGAMREAQGGRPVGRSHNQANKCRGCSVRAGCGEAL